jgi:hypothetical protein
MRNSPNYLNLTNVAIWPWEISIVNDIIRSTSLDLAHYRQQDLIREAERSRLLSAARENRVSKISRFIRLPVGRVIVAAGRRIQGRAASPLQEGNASAALKLAR